MTTGLTGPLAEIRVLEFASLAPAPFACTLLSDLGADVLRITNPADRGLTAEPHPGDPLDRGRSVAALDLKRPRDVETALELAAGADVLVEGFRPGVMERLGLGPDDCLKRNPRLIYARMTGWGQDGPLASRAGHDINYLAIAGALEPLGPFDGPPSPPLNYVADFGGGGMLLAVGVLAALVERERSGRGQVVDAAMTDGAAMLTGILHGLRARGLWQERRGENLLDGSAPFYATYTCADSRFVAVGAVEPQFYAQLVDRLGLADRIDPARQLDRTTWGEMRRLFTQAFASRARDEWAEEFAGTDACVTPVLTPWEASGHPHNIARGTFTKVAGHVQPAPAPRFSRTPAADPPTPPHQVARLDDYWPATGASGSPSIQ
ncbi:MAG TPA: CaiB/BaiF CoA-transferase family protein [Actinocrinis sp.]|uniref:CaiB/BaiF CoA transferase family protein n=1 Tax=Actinocrinis sp. TaxID=1920516 RepID=UPI002D6BBAEB|nr:CaiB/BaiF CoA-transferase family protein [Actinocrinis sp.]HZU54448.1 CaiB/BaiF CoA-transferase family protein [Actinocrinis sp.]